MQDPEMPPVTDDSQARAAEGADIDAVVQQAQNERRMKEAFAIQPDRPVTDVQLNRLQEFQGAMDVHEGRIADRAEAEAKGDDFFIESDKPLDSTQAEVGQQGDDLEELSKLFGESSDKEHQETAWKLFDEFVDKNNLNKKEERARRNYLIGVSREAPAPGETSSEPSPETPAPDGDQPGEQSSTDDDSEEVPAEAAPEASADGTEEQTPAEGEKPKVETPPSSDTVTDLADNPNNDAERGSAIPFGGVEGSDISDSEYPVESTGEAIEFKDVKSPEATDDEEADKGFTEKLRGMWARVKAAPVAVVASIENYFTGGTPEQNQRNRNVALAAGVIAFAGCIAIELAGGSGSGREVSANLAQGIGHASPPGLSGGAFEHIQTVGDKLRTIHDQLGSGGDNIWTHAHEALKGFGAKVSNHNIFRLTKDILDQNHLTWESARHLPEGFTFTINPPAWVK